MNDRETAVVLADIAIESARRTAPAADATRRAVLDWFAVVLGGSLEPQIRALADEFGSASGPSRVIGPAGRRASSETAAFLNGTAAHVLELDDIYAPGLYHPGAPTIAAALAVADASGASGEALMRGIVAGVEVGCRVAEDLGAEHYRRWHTTGTAGSVGAAVGAAVVLGASRDEIAHAIAIAGTMAAGLQQTFRGNSLAKPLHAGHAAQSGVTAARSARAGLTGALDVLEGEAGLAMATGVESAWSASRRPWDDALAIQKLTVKPYPCCGHTFAPIDAARELRSRGVRIADVANVRVETYATAIRTAGVCEPRTPSEARFSIPFALAVSLRDGAVVRSSFDLLDDMDVNAVVARTTMVTDAEFDAAAPHRRGARVVVQTRNGESHVAEMRDRRGSPENPLALSDIEAKFDDLVVGTLGAAAAESLRASIADIATIDDVNILSSL